MEALEAAIAERAAKDEQMKATAASVKRSQDEYSRAEASTRSSLQAWAELRESRAKVAEVVGGPLGMLVDGGWEDDGAKEEAVKAVTGCLAEASVDRALVAAVPPALGLKPDSRTPFDDVVVTSVKDVLGPRLEELERKVEEIGTEETNLRAEVLGLWAIMDVAKERAATAAREAKAAQRAVHAAVSAAEAAAAEAREQALKEEAARLAEQATHAAEGSLEVVAPPPAKKPRQEEAAGAGAEACAQAPPGEGDCPPQAEALEEATAEGKAMQEA